ncbi:MAG: hypothetical protein SO010_10960 [Candidatus Limiplasma sp.]|nr:hypothetical protein [Candidatus Limiplasma sp.]
MKTFSKGQMTVWSLLIIMLLLTATLLTGGLRRQNVSWNFGAWNQPAVEAARAAYQAEESAENLSFLLKGLCWQYKLQQDERVKPELLFLGQQLLDCARDGTADLEKLDEDGVLSQVLLVIREVEAR